MVSEFLFTPLPQEVLANNVVTLATVTTDPNAPVWTLEGSTTQPIIGMGDFVLSAKRRAYAEVERDQLSGSISDLQVCARLTH